MAKAKIRPGTSDGPDDLDNIKNGDLTIKLTKSSLKSKSLAWSYFGSLYFKQGDKIVESKKNKWLCNVCLKEAAESRLFNESNIKSFSANNSTTSLLNHVEKDHKISISSKTVEESTKTIQKYFSTERTVHSSKKNEIKFVLIRDLVLVCCRDLLPFNLVDGTGLRDFQEKYNVVDALDLPHRTSISRALTTVYNDCKAWLVDHIRTTCPSTVAVTFDGWSDKYRRRNYITLTLHFVNKSFELVNLTLATKHFPDRHKGKIILPFIESLLDCYGLSQKNIYMVTDAAKNMKYTCNLGTYENISCVGHALHNLVAVDGFQKTEALRALLKKVKNIVKALRYRTDEFEKLTNDQGLLAAEISEWSEVLLLDEDDEETEEMLEALASTDEDDKSSGGCETSLKMDVKTRWHSILMMVESLVAYNKNVINVMLLNTEHSELTLVNDEIQLLKELVVFLKHFQRITAIFSGDQYATLNYYVVFRSEIFSLLESEPQDSYEVKMMKNNMMAKFDYRFPLSDIVVLASLLDPRFQNLLDIKNYLYSMKSSAVEFLVKCVKDIGTDCISSSPNNTSCSKSESYVEELAEKHSTLASVARTSTSQTDLERECYLLFSMHNKIKITNVLTYWKDHTKLMPTLSNVAAQIYGIPATSTPSERNFSVAGLIVNQRRTQITPDNLHKVVFMHNNYDFVKNRVAQIELKD